MNKAMLSLIIAFVVMNVVNDGKRILRAFIGPKLEEHLGRPLAEWDWRVYWQEKANRNWYIAWNNFIIQKQQQFVDRQIIHDFVWNEGAGESKTPRWETEQ